jgi:hypothetical protein
VWNDPAVLPAQTICAIFENAVVLSKLLLLPILMTRSMTGEQSRLLKVGDRVSWHSSLTDLGTVVETTWNGVTIDWDDGHTTSIQHNDMAHVERVPMKLV